MGAREKHEIVAIKVARRHYTEGLKRRAGDFITRFETDILLAEDYKGDGKDITGRQFSEIMNCTCGGIMTNKLLDTIWVCHRCGNTVKEVSLMAKNEKKGKKAHTKCLCGCGFPCKSRFLSGHDGFLIKVVMKNDGVDYVEAKEMVHDIETPYNLTKEYKEEILAKEAERAEAKEAKAV